MSSYAFDGMLGIEFARPVPLHALQPSALAAVEAHRRVAHETKAQRVLDDLVTDHGRPHVEPYLIPEIRVTKKGKRKPTGAMIPGDPMTTAARRLVADAEASGFRVRVVEQDDRVLVQGQCGTVGFIASWIRGRAHKASWHEATMRFAMIEDERPVGVAKLTRTGLARHRAAGVDRLHLRIIASPDGVPIPFAELSAKVRAS
jgi:hypothetical protein